MPPSPLIDPLLSDPDLVARLVAFAGELADAAREETLRHFRTGIGIENKAEAGFDPVTPADRAAEQRMRVMIIEHFPDHGILGEEFDERPAAGPFQWTLDPIDGTRAFIAGIPLWGVLIALSVNGRPMIGVIDQPYLDERYIGFPGDSVAMIRGRAVNLRTRACERLDQAVLATTDPFLFPGAEAQAFARLREHCRLSRFGADCYAYALLAAGEIDLVVESGLKPWDVRALIPVITGAGGIVTHWRGGAASGGGQVIAAGDSRIHAQALSHLRRAARTEG